MEFKRRILLFGILTAILLPTAVSLSGCSSNDTVKEDPAKEKARVDNAGKMRSYFDKAQGNYEALSLEDKTALNALTGSEKKSKEAFGHMVYVPGGGGGGLPPSGPGTH